jgi:hypothetical protein
MMGVFGTCGTISSVMAINASIHKGYQFYEIHRYALGGIRDNNKIG